MVVMLVMTVEVVLPLFATAVDCGSSHISSVEVDSVAGAAGVGNKVLLKLMMEMMEEVEDELISVFGHNIVVDVEVGACGGGDGSGNSATAVTGGSPGGGGACDNGIGGGAIVVVVGGCDNVAGDDYATAAWAPAISAPAGLVLLLSFSASGGG